MTNEEIESLGQVGQAQQVLNDRKVKMDKLVRPYADIFVEWNGYHQWTGFEVVSVDGKSWWGISLDVRWVATMNQPESWLSIPMEDLRLTPKEYKAKLVADKEAREREERARTQQQYDESSYALYLELKERFEGKTTS